MTQEDKELLLKDLCSRLPYEVKVRIDFGKHCARYGIAQYVDDTVICVYPETFEIGVNDEDQSCSIDDIKSYLRPMSSMTEEERKEYNDIVKNTIDFYDCPKSEEICFFNIPIEWLNAHHFDYRGLIEKDLALEAPEGMYNIKKE